MPAIEESLAAFVKEMNMQMTARQMSLHDTNELLLSSGESDGM